jgi:hypothetical protein
MTTLIPQFDLKNGGSTPTGAVNLPINQKLQQFINVLDFGADPTGTTDSTTAIQNAINYAMAATNGLPNTVYLPAGTFKITANLNITKAIWIRGESKQTTTISIVSGTASTVFSVYTGLGNTNQILGGGISDMILECNSNCKGIQLRATSPYPITRMVFENLWVKDATQGIDSAGDTGNVFYFNIFRNINIANNTSSLNGFLMNGAAYNLVEQVESTGVPNGGLGFNITQSGGAIRNLTTDGVSFIDIPGGTLDTMTCETIYATTPVNPTCLRINRALSASNIYLIDIDNSKCNYGIGLGDSVSSLNNVSFNNGTTTAPYYTLNLTAGGSGIISNFYVPGGAHYYLEGYTSAALMESYKFINCSTITFASNLGSNLVASLPTASAVYQGNMLVVPGATGVADHLYVCLKNASNTYAWVQIA